DRGQSREGTGGCARALGGVAARGPASLAGQGRGPSQGAEGRPGPPLRLAFDRPRHSGGSCGRRPRRDRRGSEGSNHRRRAGARARRRRCRSVRCRHSAAAAHARRTMNAGPPGGRRSLDVFMVACEGSADALGAGLMRGLASARAGAISFRGVGGARMLQAGLESLYPIEDLVTIGIAAVLAKLPLILRRLRQTVEAIASRPPDVLILIDAPDFTHRIAARVRRRLPDLPIVKYVSPTVWVWRPGRARAMRSSIDLVLALLPFEPEVHRYLGGPACVYVGHPLLEHLGDLRPSPVDMGRR